MEFKDRVRALRLSKGLTQTELADAITKINKYKVARSTVAQWEVGSRTPYRETVEALCDFFQVDYDYIMGKSDDMGRFTTDEVLAWNKDSILKWAETADTEEIKAVLRALMDRLM